jgi:ABC-type polysaccharide/polyol phosphate export permease
MLGLIALGLLAGVALSSKIHLSVWLAAPFLIFGLIFAVLCAFYRDIDGQVSYRMLSVRFSGPKRAAKRSH